MSKVKLVVTTEYDKQRFDVALCGLASISRSHANDLIYLGDAQLNDKQSKPGKLVNQGDIIAASIKEPEKISLEPEVIPLDIVYQDSQLCVINKPQGLVVHPSSNCFSGTLVNALLYHIKDLSGINGELRPGIVHRLDKNTSGLMVVAKSNVAHNALAKQIASKECGRVYIALLEGVLKTDSGEISQPIGRSQADRKLMAITKGGRDAQTVFTVLRRFEKYTLVRFQLRTGRTHQIRVHAKYLGHPVVGDSEYGFKKQRFNLKGQLLHSASLTFTHPETKEVMTFCAKLPNYFVNVLKSLV